jgi:hypothetical protein
MFFYPEKNCLLKIPNLPRHLGFPFFCKIFIKNYKNQVLLTSRYTSIFVFKKIIYFLTASVSISWSTTLVLSRGGSRGIGGHDTVVGSLS